MIKVYVHILSFVLILGGGSAAATQANTVERTISDDQHTAALEASAAASLSLSQMNQLSFNNTTNGSLGGLAAHSIHTAKLLKENSNNEIEPHPQDSDSLEENHAHMHMQIVMIREYCSYILLR